MYLARPKFEAHVAKEEMFDTDIEGHTIELTSPLKPLVIMFLLHTIYQHTLLNILGPSRRL